MARARNIKPGLFKNEILGVADPLYTLLFEGLWILADRDGRLEDRPLRIKAEVFPYRDANADAMLTWLHEHEFIRRYQVAGKRYILICEFAKHQNPHKNETESVIPPPDDSGCTSEEIGTPSENLGSTRADSLSTDSLNRIPDSLPSVPAGTDAGKPARKPRGAKFAPEDFEVTPEMQEWAAKDAPSVDWQQETEKFRDWEFKHPRTDWTKVWRTWMRKANDEAAKNQPRRASSPAAPESFAERDRRAAMERWEQMTGQVHPDRTQTVTVIDQPLQALGAPV